MTVGGEPVSAIGPGLLVLLGVGREDAEADADYLADKVVNLRIFEDDGGQMNLSVLETRGAVLVVSQFTLYGDARRGRRPGFSTAAPPDEANRLYRCFVTRVAAHGLEVKEGVFRAMMDVRLVNHGPVTLLLDSIEKVCKHSLVRLMRKAHDVRAAAGSGCIRQLNRLVALCRFIGLLLAEVRIAEGNQILP